MNLCVNAGHAMKEHGGVLGIRLACVDIDRDFAIAHPELTEGPHVCLEVSDSGSGAAPKRGCPCYGAAGNPASAAYYSGHWVQCWNDPGESQSDGHPRIDC